MNAATLWKGVILPSTSEEIGGTVAFHVKDVILTVWNNQLVSRSHGFNTWALVHNYTDFTSETIRAGEMLVFETEIIHLDRHFEAGESLTIQVGAQATYDNPLGVHVTGAI